MTATTSELTERSAARVVVGVVRVNHAADLFLLRARLADRLDELEELLRQMSTAGRHLRYGKWERETVEWD